MSKNRTVTYRPDGTLMTFGRNLTKAEKKQIRRRVTGERLVTQARKDNPAVTIRMAPALQLVLSGKVRK